MAELWLLKDVLLGAGVGAVIAGMTTWRTIRDSRWTCASAMGGFLTFGLVLFLWVHVVGHLLLMGLVLLGIGVMAVTAGAAAWLLIRDFRWAIAAAVVVFLALGLYLVDALTADTF